MEENRENFEILFFNSKIGVKNISMWNESLKEVQLWNTNEKYKQKMNTSVYEVS